MARGRALAITILLLLRTSPRRVGYHRYDSCAGWFVGSLSSSLTAPSLFHHSYFVEKLACYVRTCFIHVSNADETIVSNGLTPCLPEWSYSRCTTSRHPSETLGNTHGLKLGADDKGGLKNVPHSRKHVLQTSGTAWQEANEVPE